MDKKLLHITSDIAGLHSGVQQFKISFRDVSNYAAAIGDTNSRYFDSSHAYAHPIFPVVLTWQALQRKDNGWGTQFSEEIRNRMVHYDEYLEFKNLLQAEDRLVATSRVIGIEKHKLGTKMQVKISYQTERGDEVVTEYVSSIMFGVTCDQDKVVEKSPIAIKQSEGSGRAIWETSVQIDKTAPFLYDGCTGISARIHTDEHYARSLGLPGIIYHGTASLARSITAIIDKELNGDAAGINSVSSKFIGKLTIPNILKISLLAREGNRLHFLTNDQNGQPILAGNLTIR